MKFLKKKKKKDEKKIEYFRYNRATNRRRTTDESDVNRFRCRFSYYFQFRILYYLTVFLYTDETQ